jgi:hypothetical protein
MVSLRYYCVCLLENGREQIISFRCLKSKSIRNLPPNTHVNDNGFNTITLWSFSWRSLWKDYSRKLTTSSSDGSSMLMTHPWSGNIDQKNVNDFDYLNSIHHNNEFTMKQTASSPSRTLINAKDHMVPWIIKHTGTLPTLKIIWMSSCNTTSTHTVAKIVSIQKWILFRESQDKMAIATGRFYALLCHLSMLTF